MRQTGDPVWDAPDPKPPEPAVVTTIEVTRIVLLIQHHGSDMIYVETTLPPAVWPFEEPAALKFEIARGTGQKYLQEAFPGVDIKVIDVRAKTSR